MVIAILGILAAIAIPAYTTYKTNAQQAANEATAKTVYDAALVADTTTAGSGTTGWTGYVDTKTAARTDVTVTYDATDGYYVKVGTGTTQGTYGTEHT